MTLPQEPGNTSSTAYNLGNLGEIQTFTEFVGSTDTTDIYKFSLTDISDFSLTVDEFTGYLGTYLYIDSNRNGRINESELIGSDEYGYDNLEIDSTLGAADYFLKINRRQDTTNTNYNLSLSAAPNLFSLAPEPGNTGSNAYNLGNLGEIQTFTEFVGSTDTTDIYKFSLTEISDFNLTIDEFAGYLGAYLYIDSNRNGYINESELIGSDEYGYDNLEIDSTLGAANYFLKINRRQDTTNTNYNLSLSAAPNLFSLDPEPGNTGSNAYNLGNLGEIQTFTEFVGSTDTTDIYKFSLTEISDFNLTIDEFAGYLDAYLYIDSNRNGRINESELIGSDEYESDEIEIDSTLGAANYFLKINRRQDTTNTNYNLSLSAAPNLFSLDPEPGNTGSNAYNLGNLGEIQTFTEFVGSTDTTDIYKFSLTEISDFNLIIDEFAGYLGAYLYIDSNRNGRINESELIGSDEYGYNNLEIDSTLGAANYFLKINRRQDTTNTNYNLSLSAAPNLFSLDPEPGNTSSDAYVFESINLDTSEDNRSLTEFVGSTDTTDIYKFSLLQDTELDFSVTNHSSDINVKLSIDSDLDGEIDDSDEVLFHKPYWSSATFNSTLGAADYFISIVQQFNTANTNYDLDLKYTANSLSTVTITANESEAQEEGTNEAKFKITRDGDTSKARTIDYVIATGSGQATNGIDYEELSGSITIPSGQESIDLVVNPIDDDIVEAYKLEQVTITLKEIDGDVGTKTTQTATVTIEDNDVIPNFTIEVTDNQGSEEGSKQGQLRIRHDVDTNKPRIVNYQIATGNNQAINGVDYEELSGSVIIPAGQDYVDLFVTPNDDFLVENTEQVTITVEDVDGNPGTLDNQTATINLKDNDEHPTFTIEAADDKAKEARNNTGRFRIRHDGNNVIPHMVNYQIVTGSNQATNGIDYAELSSSITIPVGQKYIDLLITPIDDDSVEEIEKVTITVKDALGNLGTADNQTATINIEDNDFAPPVFSIEAADNQAGEERTNTGRFRLRHNGNDAIPQTVNYQIATGNGQAVNGVDYTEISNSITFPAGQQYFDLLIQPTDDRTVEETERVTITVKNVDGNLGTASNQTASLTIQDNDEYPIFSIEASDNQAGEEGTNTGRFRIRHDGDTSQPQTVNYQIATGNNQAINGVDYTELSNSITIPAGQGYVDFSVIPTDDDNIEETEQVTITLRDINGDLGTRNNQSATLTIQDNDEELLDSPIFRFHNDNVPGTYLFAGEQERNYITENFTNFDEEGMAFKVGAEPVDNLIPIYRFQSLTTPGTYLFVGESERQGINESYSNSFDEEGLAFYVYGVGEGKGTTFYRFHNTGQPGTYIFAGSEERANILENFPSFVEEGAAFEVGI